MAFTGEWQEKRSHVSPTLRCLPIVSSALGLVVKVGPVFRSPAPSQAAPWGSEQWLRAAQSHCPFTHTQTCHCHWPFTQTCHCHCSHTDMPLPLPIYTQTCHYHCPFTHRHTTVTATAHLHRQTCHCHLHTDMTLSLSIHTQPPACRGAACRVGSSPSPSHAHTVPLPL